MQLANYLRMRIRERSGFRLVIEVYNVYTLTALIFPTPFQEQQYTNVCFWYIPPCLRQCEEEAEWKQRLHKVAPL